MNRPAPRRFHAGGAPLITIDGTMGEGGGQVLRSALALACVTQQPFQIRNIRGGRGRPGLLRQHLAAVRAAATVADARVTGDALGSRELTFVPRGLQAGNYRFAVGSAGSALLVLQTVLPALCAAGGPSTLTCEGGTHNPAAPPFDFCDRVWLPLVRRMGPQVQMRLDRWGFFPRGGGSLHATITPAPWVPLDLRERGHVRAVRASAVVAGLPRHIAERELRVVRTQLGWAESDCVVVEAPDAQGPGNVVLAQVTCAHATALCTAFGSKGTRAEHVATEVARDVQRWLDAGVPVGEHLADQLLLPCALAGGGRFVTQAPTPHLLTNADVIRRFRPDLRIGIERIAGAEAAWAVTVRTA